jgi:hypothetical protein
MPKPLSPDVRLIHAFLKARYASLAPFTKADLKRRVRGKAAFDTYWNKKIETLLIESGEGSYRVSEAFRRVYARDAFAAHFSQTTTLTAAYRAVESRFVSFQFFLPLAHEGALRETLDSLFYSDRLLRRLKILDARRLEAHFGSRPREGKAAFYDRVLREIAGIFKGYSVGHVDGRFRGAPLLGFAEAQRRIDKEGLRYLYDETSAVIRFVVPLGPEGDESPQAAEERIRWIFREIFVQAMLERINGEAEVWLLEEGVKSALYRWLRAD